MCGVSYEKQAKLIAIIELVTSLVGFLFVSFSTLILGFSPELRDAILKDDDNLFSIILHFSLPEKVSSVAVPVIYFIGEFLLAAFLYRGISHRNYSHLRIWYIVTITVCMTAAYFFLPGVFFTDDSLYFIGVFVASYAFTGYSVWVLYCFMEELRREGIHKLVADSDDDGEKL